MFVRRLHLQLYPGSGHLIDVVDAHAQQCLAIVAVVVASSFIRLHDPTVGRVDNEHGGGMELEHSGKARKDSREQPPRLSHRAAWIGTLHRGAPSWRTPSI